MAGLLGEVIDLVKPGGKLEMLTDAKVVEQSWLVGEEGELPLGSEWAGREVLAGDLDRALCGWDDSGEATQRGGFACAVGSDEPANFAGLHRDGRVPNRRKDAIELGQRLDVYHRRGGNVQNGAGLGIADCGIDGSACGLALRFSDKCRTA